jgi:hypothetical protein
MKNLILLLIVLSAVLSCRNSDKALIRQDKKISRQAVAVAEDYAKGQLKNASRSVTEQGIIVLSDSLSKILIDQSKIVTGDFEGDTLTDAIVPIYIFRGQGQDITINLFLVNNEGRLMTVRALEDDMKVLSVMKRVIYIEMPLKSADETKPVSMGNTEVKEFIFIGDSPIKDITR